MSVDSLRYNNSNRQSTASSIDNIQRNTANGEKNLHDERRYYQKIRRDFSFFPNFQRQQSIKQQNDRADYRQSKDALYFP